MLIQERGARREEAPRVTMMASAPVEARLRGWVERLAVPRHMRADARNNAWVREEVVAALRACGLEVRLQGRYGNVVAFSPGAERPLVAIAAHYDSVSGCPGADDNASGLAVMLECARVLAASGRAGSVAFLAFNGEEDDLAGSRDFVANGMGVLPSPLTMVHVLEMVGFRSRAAPLEELPLPWMPASLKASDFIGLIAKGGSNRIARLAAASPAAPGLRVVTARTWGPLHRWFPDLTRSDHFPFWSAEIPAVLWTDTGNFRNPNYHRPSDTPDTLDYVFMRDVGELLCSIA
jgi:hypothetical protein